MKLLVVRTAAVAGALACAIATISSGWWGIGWAACTAAYLAALYASRHRPRLRITAEGGPRGSLTRSDPEAAEIVRNDAD